MSIRTRTRTSIAAVAVASVVGGGIAGTVLAGPTAAIAQEAEDDTTVMADGFQTIDDVLSGLVGDGVITQAQADAVGEALQAARPHRGSQPGMGHGFGGGGLDDVADVLGVTRDELRTAIVDGSSIADVADANGVDVQVVIDMLVARAQDHLDAAVADGRLTADEAADRAADIESRVTDAVNGEIEFGRGRGFGRGFRAFDGGDEGSGATAEGAVFDA